MPHDAPHGHAHPHDHNHAHGPDHLHSHIAARDDAEALRVLADQFVEGFRAAKDKVAYLRLAGVPLALPDGRGGPSLKLVDVRLTTEWQVGTASPSFGSRDLSWLPFPGSMVAERANMAFVYVSLDETRSLDLREFLRAHPAAREADGR
ncbi:MAG: hypothetical protein EA355_15065 [Rhodobacteraceae bacterium]|nr:MAG: hypothetical protein EA355_15065 [Paracoccaceae bacterium]